MEFMEEMRALGETVWEGIVPKGNEPLERFVNRLVLRESQPEPGLVCETSYWAIRNHSVAGRITIRHELNDFLKQFGGHIGYEVRPSARRQGVATAMLREILKTERAQQIGRVLLTCDPDNVGSAKTILANGGVLEKTEISKVVGRMTNYYWIGAMK